MIKIYLWLITVLIICWEIWCNNRCLYKRDVWNITATNPYKNCKKIEILNFIFRTAFEAQTLDFLLKLNEFNIG